MKSTGDNLEIKIHAQYVIFCEFSNIERHFKTVLLNNKMHWFL